MPYWRALSGIRSQVVFGGLLVKRTSSLWPVLSDTSAPPTRPDQRFYLFRWAVEGLNL